MLVNYQSRKGQSLVEMCAGLLIAIPILLLIVQTVEAFIGFQVNEKTCREAARVAANGDPASAEQRAQSIVSKANEEKSWIVADLHLNSVKSMANPMNVQLSKGSIPFGSVEVETAVEIKPIFLSQFVPKNRFCVFVARQSFPYTYVLPASTSSQ